MCDVCWRLEVVHRVELCMLEAMEGEVCLPEVLEVGER